MESQVIFLNNMWLDQETDNVKQQPMELEFNVWI